MSLLVGMHLVDASLLDSASERDAEVERLRIRLGAFFFVDCCGCLWWLGVVPDRTPDMYR